MIAGTFYFVSEALKSNSANCALFRIFLIGFCLTLRVLMYVFDNWLLLCIQIHENNETIQSNQGGLSIVT